MVNLIGERRNISDEVYDILYNKILQRQYQKGHRLKLRDLEEELGISRTPIISAIQRLAEIGLVKIVPRRGIYIASPSAKEILDTLDIRQVLELYAVRRAALQASPELIIELQRVVAQMRVALEKNKHLEYVNLDVQFHDLIISASGNDALVSNYRTLKMQSIISGIRFSFPHPVHDITHSQHEAIIQALLARDPERAAAIINEHIEQVKRGFIEMHKSEFQPIVDKGEEEKEELELDI